MRTIDLQRYKKQLYLLVQIAVPYLLAKNLAYFYNYFFWRPGRGIIETLYG
jgi:hypothetical protein